MAFKVYNFPLILPCPHCFDLRWHIGWAHLGSAPSCAMNQLCDLEQSFCPFLDLGFLIWNVKGSALGHLWLTRLPSSVLERWGALSYCWLLELLFTWGWFSDSTSSELPWPLYSLLFFQESGLKLLLRLGFKTPQAVRTSSLLKTNSRMLALPRMRRSYFLCLLCHPMFAYLLFNHWGLTFLFFFFPLQIPASWACGPLWKLSLCHFSSQFLSP